MKNEIKHDIPGRIVLKVYNDSITAARSIDIQKLKIEMLINHNSYTRTELISYEDENKLCCIIEEKKLFISRYDAVYEKATRNPYGFTMNKKTNKLSFWFGVSMFQWTLQFEEWFVYHKYDWFVDFCKSHPFYITQHISKAVLEKVLLRKITNFKKMYKAIAQSKLGLKISEIDTNVIAKLYASKEGLNNFGITSLCEKNLSSIRRILDVSTNKPEMMKQILRSYESDDKQSLELIEDMVNECLVFNKKINPKWSLKRINEEHTENTRKLMDIEQKNVEDVEFYKNPSMFYGMFSIVGLELITSMKRLYIEGRLMDHCVYTGHKESVRNHSAIIFHHEAENATLEVHYYNKKWNKGQFYKKQNRPVPSEIHEQIKRFIDEPDVQSALSELIKVELSLPQSKELVEQDIFNNLPL